MENKKRFIGREVLILGSGDGKLISSLIKEGANLIVGVELNDDKIEKTRSQFKNNDNVKIWQVDIFSKEFQLFCSNYDIIFSEIKLSKVENLIKYLIFLDLHCRQALEISHLDFSKTKLLELLKIHTSFKVYQSGRRLRGAKGGTEIRVEDWIDLPITWVPAEDIRGPSITKGEQLKASKNHKELKENIIRNGLRSPIIVAKNERGGRSFVGLEGGKRLLILRDYLKWKDIPCKIASSQKRFPLRF